MNRIDSYNIIFTRHGSSFLLLEIGGKLFISAHIVLENQFNNVGNGFASDTLINEPYMLVESTPYYNRSGLKQNLLYRHVASLVKIFDIGNLD